MYSVNKRIPVLDLKRQYEQIGAELEQSVLAVLRSGSYILGANLANLESSTASLCDCSWGVGVANGTDALLLALWALDVGPGDEVVTTPFTFAATVEAILLRGARPVFVDVDGATFNIDPDRVEQAITSRSRVILPVHLYGQPADMDKLLSIAARHRLRVVEDNAQAIGATYRGRRTGSFGDLACISFYPTKNLGACGDAGMIVTNDAALADRVRVLRAHGSRQRYYHEELGVNSRLDEVQAAVLLAKLPYLESWNERRRVLAGVYDRALSGCPGVVTPRVIPAASHVWHQYTVRISSHSGISRDEVKKELAARGVDSMCYYPLPLHLQPAFAALGYRQGDFPVAEAVAQEVLSLPMYPELTEQEVLEVAAALKDVLTAGNLGFAPARAAVPPGIGI